MNVLVLGSGALCCVLCVLCVRALGGGWGVPAAVSSSMCIASSEVNSTCKGHPSSSAIRGRVRATPRWMETRTVGGGASAHHPQQHVPVAPSAEDRVRRVGRARSGGRRLGEVLHGRGRRARGQLEDLDGRPGPDDRHLKTPAEVIRAMLLDTVYICCMLEIGGNASPPPRGPRRPRPRR